MDLNRLSSLTGSIVWRGGVSGSARPAPIHVRRLRWAPLSLQERSRAARTGGASAH
jgi:hypothetical protein